jgi:hypothetical protein
VGRKIDESLRKNLLAHIHDAERMNDANDRRIAFQLVYLDEGLRVSIGSSNGVIVDWSYRMSDKKYSGYQGQDFSNFVGEIIYFLEKEQQLPMGREAMLDFPMEEIDREYVTAVLSYLGDSNGKERGEGLEEETHA